MRVLIVRPEPGNGVTAAAVGAMGLDPVAVPLFAIVPTAWDAPDPAAFDAVAMTSANAARHGGADLARYRHLPLYAVGEATAAAARDAGFARVVSGGGDAAALGAIIADTPRVLHFAGTPFRAIPTTTAVSVRHVYAAVPLTPAQPLRADVALVHSPRAGERLAALMPHRSATHLIAISAAAARACGSGWAAMAVAAHPRDDAMLECLARLCEAGGSSTEGPVA